MIVNEGEVSTKNIHKLFTSRIAVKQINGHKNTHSPTDSFIHISRDSYEEREETIHSIEHTTDIHTVHYHHKVMKPVLFNGLEEKQKSFFNAIRKATNKSHLVWAFTTNLPSGTYISFLILYLIHSISCSHTQSSHTTRLASSIIFLFTELWILCDSFAHRHIHSRIQQKHQFIDE